MDKLNGFDIVCISSSNWDHPWGSKQQIMSRISLDNKVLYVEYQASFFHIYRPFLTKRLSAFFGRLNKITDNLYIYTPPLCLLPFGYYIRFINKMSSKIKRPIILLFGDSITQQSFNVTYRGWGAATADWYNRYADVINRGFSGIIA